MSRAKVHIFDSHVYIFRAYYSLPPMASPGGKPTSAAYGFANTLLKYIFDEEPSYLVCCFDAAATSFRNEIFPEYKASRLEPPADLEPQFEICRLLAKALGIPCFEVENFEADDLIATLTDRVLTEGGEVRIVSSDKDLAQLITEDGRSELFDLARDTLLDANGVRNKFGVSPAQIPDYLGLAGDAVDELPGVPGIGSKGAAAALSAFGALEDFPESLNEWETVPFRGPRKLGERFLKHRGQAFKMRRLATVVRDVPALSEISIQDLTYKGALEVEIGNLFEELGWGNITTRIRHWA